MLPPAPGKALREEALGPAHVLFRRAIERQRPIPAAAVRLEAPLRTARGKIPVGSDFLSAKTLRQLLTWVEPARRPDLAIVLIDQDERPERRRLVTEAVQDFPLSTSRSQVRAISRRTPSNSWIAMATTTVGCTKPWRPHLPRNG